MAMAGLRDLSIIATPPAAPARGEDLHRRMADRADPRGVPARDSRAAARSISCTTTSTTIENIARELRTLVPEARIRIAHGQMPRARARTASCSISITPALQRAGVHDDHRERHRHADARTRSSSTAPIDFGLAQLHQLRGRVGRSHHRAYAYLIAPPKRAMTRRCREAARGHRVARGARRRLHARDARSRDPRRRRAAGRRPERPDPGHRFHALQRAARRAP